MSLPSLTAGFPGQVQAVAQRSALVTLLHYRAETPSTNDEALQLARAGAPHGTLVLADRQTAGRGRHGRHWESPAGVGLWMSFVLRPDLPPDRSFGVTAAAAVAVADTVERSTGRVASLRWPNDVMVGGKKASGLLAEAGHRGERCDYIVLGVGLNINQAEADFPPELHGLATSLRLLAGRELDRAAVLSVFLEAFEFQYRRLLADQGRAVREEWLSRAPLIGRPVRVTLGMQEDPAAETFTARAAGLAEDGALIVERADGSRQEVRAADVRLFRDDPGGEVS